MGRNLPRHGTRLATVTTALILLVVAALMFAPPTASGQFSAGRAVSVTLTRADGTVTASWDAVSGATRYHVTYTSDNTQSWTAASDSHTGSSITFSVDNAKTYVVGVRAGKDVNNTTLWSGWTNSDPIAPIYTPGQVGHLSAERSGTGISVTWTAPANNGGSAVTGYAVKYTVDGAHDWTRVHTGLGATTTSATISDVDNAVGYVVAVRANNGVGEGAWTNSAPVAGLAGPASVTAYKGGDYVEGLWTAVADATGYDVNLLYWHDHFHYRIETNMSGTSRRIYIKDGADFTPDQFVIALRARNAHGPGAWVNSAPATPAPALTVSGITATGATLNLPYQGAWHYKADAGPDSACQGPVSGTTENLTGLTGGTTYIYAAYNDSAYATVIATASAFTTPGIVLTPSSLSVTKGGTATYTVKLATQPTHDVSVAVTAATESDDDTDVTVQDTDDNTTGNQTTAITFTSQNWNTARTITLAAESVSDAADGSRDITHTAASSDTDYSGVTATLTATESDTTAGLTSSGVTATGATLTIANITAAWYYKSTTTGKTDCTAVAANTGALDVTGLTASTSYTFSAYSDATCSTANLLAMATAFTTPAS